VAQQGVSSILTDHLRWYDLTSSKKEALVKVWLGPGDDDDDDDDDGSNDEEDGDAYECPGSE
jgi:hypothetical protein